MASITDSYPWTTAPLIVGAPMRLISGPSLVHAISSAGGIGFLAAGTDVSTLSENLSSFKSLLSTSPIPGAPSDVLPIGVGFILWGADLKLAVKALSELPEPPAAVWLFAPSSSEELGSWANGIRSATKKKSKIWIQVSCVADAIEAIKVANPDVFVIQGADAGGHGRYASAGLISLVPELIDAVREYYGNLNGGGDTSSFPSPPKFVAAGGIADERGVNAILALGADGAALGTRFLAAEEAVIRKGYQDAVLKAEDGGNNTIRTDVYDKLRGTIGWPEGYGGRGVINLSYVDAIQGVSFEENEKLYKIAEGAGDKGWEEGNARMTTYAGTAVGLVKEVAKAGDIVRELRGQRI
ncbi:hypothetical protein EYR41_002070 [Orbilia oligospora]|uniref:Uncharacterized protein n=1 Tax=Orbilia oligospora TaxID=2813651 RepID=A0A7C8PI03_ORBOL|nr:hypothetical protein TWF751_008518 [Orbilia oligospora]TGJ75124.1 hypothetical protein EYR41_002070 [Orbilia oligospora]